MFLYFLLGFYPNQFFCSNFHWYFGPKSPFFQNVHFRGPTWVGGSWYGIFLIREKPALGAGLITWIGRQEERKLCGQPPHLSNYNLDDLINFKKFWLDLQYSKCGLFIFASFPFVLVRSYEDQTQFGRSYFSLGYIDNAATVT